MDGIRTRRLCSGEYQIDVEVGLRRCRSRETDREISVTHMRRVLIWVREHGDSADPHRSGCPEHSPRDLASVGDQELPHIRKTPKPRRPSTTLLWAADNDRPSTVS